MIERCLDYLAAGGAIQLLIALDALLCYGLLAERACTLWQPATWRQRRAGELRQLLEGGHRASDEATLIGLAEHPELTRHLAVIRALIAIAPLLGLLGTVSGIIATFDQILAGGGAGGLGGGISQALVTTQLGIAVAVPALLLERLITRRAETLAAQSMLAGARHRAETA